MANSALEQLSQEVAPPSSAQNSVVNTPGKMNLTELQKNALEHLAQDQYSDAIALYEQCIEIDPAVISNYWYLGLALLLQGDKSEAQATWLFAMTQGEPEHIDLRSAQLLQILEAKALHYHKVGKLQPAQLIYGQILELQPDYALALNNLGAIFMAQRSFNEAIFCYQKAIESNPNHIESHYNLALAYRQTGKIFLATNHLNRALQIQPEFQAAYLELLNIYRSYIPNWHFPMMNDTGRNSAYQKAIEKAVTNHSLVLEIGTGSGLLAMIAARAGAKQVITCEEVELIAKKAEEIIRVNRLEDTIKVIHKKSTDLKIPEDLPDKADILVTEIFGADLLAEGAFESLAHAFDYLLKPKAQIIPKGAAIYIALIESKEIYNLCKVERVCGFDLTPFNEFSEQLIRPIDLQVYQFSQVSNVCEVERVNFKKGNLNIHDKVLELEVLKTAEVNAIACWFDLLLDDKIVLSTSPFQNEQEYGASWGQKIQILGQPIIVKQGEKIQIRSKDDNRKLLYFEVLTNA